MTTKDGSLTDCQKHGTMLEHALAYHRLGLSVVPVHPTQKKPAKKWGGKQNERADEAELRRLFENTENNPYRIGIVCGPVSGNVCVRDFDDMGAYQRWASEFPDLAATLPSVETGRGRHVYLRSTNGTKTRTAIGDGEFRGNRAFVICPPSKHETGRLYRWTRGIPDAFPHIDPEEAGLLRCWAPTRDAPAATETERTERTERTETMSSVLSVSPQDAVASAIQRTLPSAEGQRHRKLFEFARQLKAIRNLADKTPADLRGVVAAWHRAALPFIATKDFETTFWDFMEGWDKVRYPAGAQPVKAALELALKDDAPKCAECYENPKVRLLVSLCRRLQQSAGTSPFFLACRLAGELLEAPRATVARWLRGLTRDGVLELAENSQVAGGYRARRYRYCGN